jgi:hypothetical protein
MPIKAKVLCTLVPPSQLGLLMSKNPVILFCVKLFSFDNTNMVNTTKEKSKVEDNQLVIF